MQTAQEVANKRRDISCQLELLSGDRAAAGSQVRAGVGAAGHPLHLGRQRPARRPGRVLQHAPAHQQVANM